MRIYIPLTPGDLVSAVEPRLVHAVTPELKRAVPYEDAEGWEMIATLAAADDSLRLLAAGRTRRRMVCVAEVPDRSLEPALQSAAEPAAELPTARRLIASVDWQDVETILVDEPGYEDLVSRALSGEEAAFAATGDIDLLWYDVVERADLAAELGA